MKKPAKPFVPVPVGTQRRKHQRQLARMKQWRPLTFSAQRQQHRAAQQKAVAHQYHATKVKKASKARGWSPDEAVALCSARAVAESLRIALGFAVSDEDVLGLYWSVASDADAGISILDALTAAQAQGLGGCFPVNWRPSAFGDRSAILGVQLPNGEAHSLVTYDHLFWSWGEPHYPADFRGAVIEEAWAVQWLP